MDDGPRRLRDLLAGAGEPLGMKRAVEVGSVWARWAAIAGDTMAAHAEPSSLRGGVLRIRADSPAWATEIGYLRDEIRVRVNDAVGESLVEEVRVWTGPGRVRTPATSREDRGSQPPEKEPPQEPAEALARARAAWAARRNERP